MLIEVSLAWMDGLKLTAIKLAISNIKQKEKKRKILGVKKSVITNYRE